ncbi:hypothetical protein [Pseudomonas putida]|uniref:hypothetical protein n=1 Tax=Pseudomonas putida TaxID=303 RepID=UPI001595B705|nr:hypothetical protein [Pseudomonas putida]
MVEQPAVVSREPGNGKVDKPLSQHAGKLSFNESQQSAHLDKWPCRKKRKSPTACWASASLPNTSRNDRMGRIYGTATGEGKPFSEDLSSSSSGQADLLLPLAFRKRDAAYELMRAQAM